MQDVASNEELLDGEVRSKLPEGSEFVAEKDRTTNAVTKVYLVKQTPDLTGDYLADARLVRPPAAAGRQLLRSTPKAGRPSAN